jgi:hypothetical protein
MLATAGAAVAFGAFAVPSGAAPIAVKGGTYSGKTSQSSVASGFRNIKLKVKKGKVTLLTEPTVGRGDCFSTPRFTLGGETPRVKLSGRGVFSFTRTFIGSKFDRIKGRFVSDHQIEGTLVYWFADQDLCTDGKTRITFKAKR